jgi:signal transduction histidine kinase
MPDNVPLADRQGRLTAPPAVAARPAAAAASGAPAASASSPRGSDAWDTGMPRWDLLYGLAFLASVLIVSATAGSADRRTLALGALAAMVPLYLLVGRPEAASAAGTLTRRAVIYMACVVLLFAAADLAVPNTWFLVIALQPLTYQLLPARLALATSLVMTTIGASSIAYWDRTSGGLATAAGFWIAVTAFTAAFGGYIDRIITQSAERANLIAELEAARAELAEVSRQAGALAERQRLAGDIHDTLAQGFSSIVMLIQAAEAQLAEAPDSVRHQLQLAEQTARENLAEARSLVSGLTSAQLRTGTLADALRRITERAGAELGIIAAFQTAGPGFPLPAAKEVVLLRTGQEALANVRKHAAAEQVSVCLRYSASQVRLEVSDDGAGFDPDQVTGGFGLSGMRARVDEVGGTVTVRSARAQGTSVVVEVPA